MGTSYPQAGFTLLELLIASALLALLGLAGSLTLDSALRSEARIDARRQQLQQLDRAMLILQRDLAQALPRANRPPGQDAQRRALWAWATPRPEDGLILEFVRHAQPLAAAQRSTLQRVRYRLQQQVLVRESLDVADPDSVAQWQQRRLLGDIEQLQLQFFHQRQWQPAWTPPPEQAQQLPAAIRLQLDTQRWPGLAFVFSAGGEHGR